MNSDNPNPIVRLLVSLTGQITRQVSEFWGALRNTPEAFRLVWAASRLATLTGIGLALIAAFLPAAQAWAGKLIIDAIVSAVNQNLQPADGLRSVAPYLALEFALVLIGSVTGQDGAYARLFNLQAEGYR